MKTRKEDR